MFQEYLLLTNLVQRDTSEPNEINIHFNPILQRRKSKCIEIKLFAQGHRASEQKTQDLNPDR